MVLIRRLRRQFHSTHPTGATVLDNRSALNSISTLWCSTGRTVEPCEPHRNPSIGTAVPEPHDRRRNPARRQLFHGRVDRQLPVLDVIRDSVFCAGEALEDVVPSLALAAFFIQHQAQLPIPVGPSVSAPPGPPAVRDSGNSNLGLRASDPRSGTLRATPGVKASRKLVC